MGVPGDEERRGRRKDDKESNQAKPHLSTLSWTPTGAIAGVAVTT
jgi:hypothetical protein